VTLATWGVSGLLAADGTSWFIVGDYIVALDGSGHERAGWPQPLGFALNPSPGNSPELTVGADGTVYAWDYKTVMAYRADGTPLAGWPYQIPDIQSILPFSAGVYVESQLSTDPATDCMGYVMTLISTAGAIESIWPLQGSVDAVGPDGTVYSTIDSSSSSAVDSMNDWVAAYASDGTVKPGWPLRGWNGVTLGPDGQIYLRWWKFRVMTGTSMEGPGAALETRIAAVDQTGRPYAGWPITIAGAASDPVFGPDGTVYMTAEVTSPDYSSFADSILAFDAAGHSKPGWPVGLAPGVSILRSVPAVGAPSPDPPQIGSDGTVYVGASTVAETTEGGSISSGDLDAFDPSGQPKAGFPVSTDWMQVSNMFFGQGSGWFAVGRTGLVFMVTGNVQVSGYNGTANANYHTDARTGSRGTGATGDIGNESILASGPDGKVAPGWPVELPTNLTVDWANLEPDGGLLVQGHDPPDSGPVPDTTTVIRYLPDGTVAP